MLNFMLLSGNGEFILALILGAIGGVALGYLARQKLAQLRKNTVESKIQKLLEDARQESKELLLEAKDKAVHILED
ncbi:MAG: hypothetical protein HYT42_00040, partial [Candidatus Sungbacteria bacterium]|nr:hypothetical protein [Candidatus Sungbacteria bacterium]